MKKFLISLMIAGLLMFGGNALADVGSSTGGFGVDVNAIGGGVDCDLETIPNGMAGGISGAGGLATAGSDGFVFNGAVGGNASAIGGGLSGTNAEHFHPGYGDMSIGVGSRSENYAITGGSVDVNVDPDGTLICGFIPTAGGIAGGEMYGIAGQGTLNFSVVGNSPLPFWTSDGYTGGIAGQGSVGGFSGGVFAVSGPDYEVFAGIVWKKWVGGPHNGRWIYKTAHPSWRPDPHSRWRRVGPAFETVDSNAGAGVGAQIEMSGFSYSDSFRYIDFNGDSKTEGMGTFVGAGTEINSYGYEYDYDNGLGFAGSNVEGGWVAAGGAATCTNQYTPNGSASANAFGFYSAQGGLNDNFTGSAIGYSNTSVTTVNGMNGTVSTSSAGMQVTTTSGGGQSQIQVD